MALGSAQLMAAPPINLLIYCPLFRGHKIYGKLRASMRITGIVMRLRAGASSLTRLFCLIYSIVYSRYLKIKNVRLRLRL
jgi:hypothetical protein